MNQTKLITTIFLLAVPLVAMVKTQADLDLKEVIKAINFGDTKDLNIGDVYAGEFEQKLPQMQNEKTAKSAAAKGKPDVVAIPEPGFTSIFNGKDLAGWEGDDKAWIACDGAIQSTGGNTAKNWLIWRGGELRDFELRLSFKFTKGNSGVQVRSKEIAKWQVRGYQVEIADSSKMGLWHHSLAPEKYRSQLATAGQRARIGPDGQKKIEQRAEADKVRSACRDNDWNELVVTAIGPRLVQKINGVVFAELVDEDAKHSALSGLLALQDHGQGCIVAFKDIRIKHLRATDESSGSNTTKPNVVIIFTDDLGWTDLGCYGSKFYETPHIDRLANQGALFRNAYAACNVCSPTRAALMTGKYPQRVGFTDWLNPDRPSGPNSAATALPASEVTIGEAFQQSGYRTGYIGKWHLGPKEHAMPKQHGFDWQMASCKHGYPGSYFFPYKRNPKAYSTGDVPDLENGKPGDYLTDVLTTRAIGFMEETVKQGEKPFFLVLGHYAVHTPIQAPQALIEKYRVKRQRMYGGKPLKTIPEYGNTRTRGRQGDPTYAAMVESLDTNVGRVVDALDKLGVTRDTIIVFTSDNGGESNRYGNLPFGPTCNLPLRAGKGWNYDGGIRVPEFITWPGHIDPATSSERVITMDIYPTLLELTGCKSLPDQHVDGQSLAPLLTGKSKSLHRSFLAWSKPHQRGASRPSAAIIKDDWKLIHYLGTESTELYNLDDDPGEASDLSASEAGKSSELLNILNKWTEETQFKKPEFFNGKDLTGWKGNDGYWSVKDGAIVGHSGKDVPKNEFIWSDVEVKDFYLTVDVKLTPDARNAGIQFRSKPVDAHGQAHGYQADVGAGVWGKLYHEHGRGKLDWNDNAGGAVKPGQWNKYEILADGHRIWTALNGKLCVAIEDPKGELAGKIAFQIHGGPPQTVHYRNPILTHNPKIELAGLNEKELIAKLPEKELPYWSKLIVGVDPGSKAEAWAKPTFDDSKWKTMKVPGHFDAVELPGFDGVVWFRKTVELSVEQAKAAATLHLGQVDDMDVTWVNGTRVGGYEIPGHHYTVRKYPVPEGVLMPGKNVIAVRVMDHGAPGGIAGKPEQLFLQLDDERISLANPWYFAPGANLTELNKYGQVPALLRPLARPKTPVPAFADGFAINSDQTIVVLGGTNALESGRYGYLETLLTAAHPQHRVRLRNLAWQADTVYLQQRPRNFYAVNKPDYGERDGRSQIKADIVFFWMGQSESLDGPQRVDEFKAAYLKHLDQISDYTKRIVLVTPVPFSNPLRLEIDIQERNKSLAVYVDAIREIGRDRKLPVVDLATAFGWGATPFPHSQNGLHLLRDGHWDAAQAIAAQLGFADRVASIKWFDSGDPLEPPSAEKLRQAIVKKNDLWFRYWRPTNWAFLYGNRQTQPSSRDHQNPGRRWFPEEIQSALSEIEDAEQTIFERKANVAK